MMGGGLARSVGGLLRQTSVGDTLDALACMQALVVDAERQLEFPRNSHPKRHQGKHALVI